MKGLFLLNRGGVGWGKSSYGRARVAKRAPGREEKSDDSIPDPGMQPDMRFFSVCPGAISQGFEAAGIAEHAWRQTKTKAFADTAVPVASRAGWPRI